MVTKAASGAVSSAVERVSPFRVGGKKVYLPNHVVTFLRPKPGQSPTTATFEVPLTFNKLDFRDYLYHLYGVETTSIRSFINQKMPAQRNTLGQFNGQWYRPRSQKIMIVDLVKPFVWPERPAEKDMGPWDHNLFVAVEKGHSKEVAEAEARGSWGPQKMRVDEPQTRDRRELRKMAAELLTGKQQWSPGPRAYVEAEKDEMFAASPRGVDEAPVALEASEKVKAAQTETAEEVDAEIEAMSKRAKESIKEPVVENIKHGKRL